MSNYKSNRYALALVSALSGKADGQKVMANFLALLKKNQDVKKASHIIALAQDLLLKASGNKKVILETARKMDMQSLVKNFSKPGDVIEEKISPKMVAGIKVTVNNDRQLDLSLVKKIDNIF